MLVAALALAFAIGTGQHFTTFGLYVVSARLRRRADQPLPLELRDGDRLADARRAACAGARCSSGDAEQVAHLRETLGSSRGGIDYEFVGERRARRRASTAALASERLDELIVADSGLDEQELLEIVEAAHRRGVKVRVAPRTTELLVERGEYVPGQGVPLFELRPPIFAGADWAVKRSFDVVVAGADRARRPAALGC